MMEKKRRKNMHLKFYKKSLEDKNIPIELKKKLVVMLNEIIDVYYEVKPEDVKNFLPKDYCSIQFLEMTTCMILQVKMNSIELNLTIMSVATSS